MKMILADDEEIITRGIQKLIDWQAMGIEIVGVYGDGKSAFEGIMTKKPEIALLDISMPGMNGIEILRECRIMEIKTSIVFISGFQDFEYARDALKYGAVEYLLKPVIREELTGALEKCFAEIRQNRYGMGAEIKEKETNFGGLIQLENTCYIPILTEIIHRDVMDEKIKKLVKFSVSSYLDKYVESHHLGISFEKGDHILVVIKGMDRMQCHETLEWIGERVEKDLTQKLIFVMGRTVDRMSDLGVAFQECLAMRGYQFFAERLPSCVLETESSSFQKEIYSERFDKIKSYMVTAVVNKDEAAFENYFRQFEGIVYHMAKGKREDACFYFCSLIQLVQDKCKQLGIQTEYKNVTALLEIGRNTLSYELLISAYCAELHGYMEDIRKMAESSDISTFRKAKEYIEQHYAENLTLNILAEEIHMNPCYFSVFFKKNAGENFKSYVNRIRLEHAVTLMISTNKKTFDIAVESGFRDSRAFSEAFQKQYHETPNAFRKRLREK